MPYHDKGSKDNGGKKAQQQTLKQQQFDLQQDQPVDFQQDQPLNPIVQTNLNALPGEWNYK